MKRLFQILPSAVVIIVAGTVLLSCSKAPDGATSALTGTYDSLYTNVFNVSTKCKNCHQPGGSSGVTLDFTNASNGYYDLITRGLEIPSNPSQCATVKRVSAGFPANSYLMGVLFSDYNANNFAGVSGCQPNVAHLSQVSMSASEKQALIDWITAGAAR